MPKTGIFWLNIAKIGASGAVKSAEPAADFSADAHGWQSYCIGVFNENIVQFWHFFQKTDQKLVGISGNTVFMSTRWPCFEKSWMTYERRRK